MTAAEGYMLRDSEIAVDKALASGMTVVVRGDWQLLLDIDDQDVGNLAERIEQVPAMTGRAVENAEMWRSKSGNIHVAITLQSDPGNPLSSMEAVALQAILGSDWRRESLAVAGVRAGSEYYSVLFRPSGAEVVEL